MFLDYLFLRFNFLWFNLERDEQIQNRKLLLIVLLFLALWHDIIARCSSPSYQKKIGPKFLLKLFCHLISLTRRLGCSHISDPIRRSQVKPSTRPRPRPNNFIFHKIEKPSPAPVPRSPVSAIWCQWPVQICPRPPPGQLIKLLLQLKKTV